jgi:hypothetical protein
MPYSKKVPCIKCGKMKTKRSKPTQCNECRLKQLKENGFSDEHKRKLGESKMAEKNIMWRGDNVGYSQLHKWVRKRKTKPKLCEICNRVPPMDLANKGIYNRELKNWEWICRKCHMIKDGRINNLKQY